MTEKEARQIQVAEAVLAKRTVEEDLAYTVELTNEMAAMIEPLLDTAYSVIKTSEIFIDHLDPLLIDAIEQLKTTVNQWDGYPFEELRRKGGERKMSEEKQSTVIVWFSQHVPLGSQIDLIRLKWGKDAIIIQDTRSFDSAVDVVKRFKANQGDEMVIVAPMSVIGEVLKLGIEPIRAEMEQIPTPPAPDFHWEVRVGARWYRFTNRFSRIKRLVFETEPV